MYICLDCFRCFDEPQYWKETHGLDSPPYEQMSGCQFCGGAYVEAYECDCCGEWIRGDYIKTDNGERYCENCIRHYALGEE